MTAINNLAGHVVSNGKVVYSEQLRPHLHFVVVKMYEPKYEKEHLGSSSKLCIEASITTGEEHTYSNGVRSLFDAKYKEKVEESEAFKDLEQIATSQGFRVWQHGYSYQVFQESGKRMKSRTVTWLVEVPENELMKF